MTDIQAKVGARIDALPPSRRLWMWVAFIAVGGFFEIYDLSLTAPLSAGLVHAGIFKTGHTGLFGLADQATFIFATFGGLYLGVVAFAAFGDRVGRKPIFTYSLVAYAIATLLIGLQSDVWSICFWRFVAGIGLGAEAVAIDCFVVEIVPMRFRGRAFSASMCIQYCATPVAALLAALLIPNAPFGVSGWRWLTILPVIGAVVFWIFRRRLPESPRWLASKGRIDEAHAILDQLQVGAPVAPVSRSAPISSGTAGLSSRGYILRITIMMLVYFNLQNIAFFGFANWVPTLLQAQGVPLKQSLFYSAGVALAAPTAPLLLSLVADRFERKHMIILSGLGSVAFGLLLAWARLPAAWLTFGIGLALSNSVLSVNSHNYLSELYPTRIRARFVGFVYSFTRLSAAISGYIIAYILANGGPSRVFMALSAFMLIALLAVAFFGPRTRNRSSDDLPYAEVLPD